MFLNLRNLWITGLRLGWGAGVVGHALDNLHQLFTLRQPESFLPKPCSIVADEEDVEMVVLVVNKLAQLFQDELNALFIARQKIPTGLRIEFLRVRLQERRRVDTWIDTDRKDVPIFSETIPE